MNTYQFISLCSMLLHANRQDVLRFRPNPQHKTTCSPRDRTAQESLEYSNKACSQTLRYMRRRGSIKAEIQRLHGSGSLSGCWRTGCIYIGTRKGRRKSIADVENSNVTWIATERDTLGPTEETNLDGVYLAQWRENST